jgi:hypothetical protein
VKIFDTTRKHLSTKLFFPWWIILLLLAGATLTGDTRQPDNPPAQEEAQR